MMLEYRFELDDAIAFNRYFMLKSDYGRRSLRRNLICVFLLSFAILALPGVNEQDWMFQFAVAFAGSVVACTVYFLVLPLLVRRTITSVHAGPASAQPFGGRRLVLEPTGAREFSARSETFATFAAMATPVETNSHVFIQISPLQGFVIPKAKIDSGSLADLLTALKSARLTAKSVPPRR